MLNTKKKPLPYETPVIDKRFDEMSKEEERALLQAFFRINETNNKDFLK